MVSRSSINAKQDVKLSNFLCLVNSVNHDCETGICKNELICNIIITIVIIPQPSAVESAGDECI